MKKLKNTVLLMYIRNTDYWILAGRLPLNFTAGGTAHIKIQEADSRIIVDSLFHK